jgi:hypothetical protein
MAVGQPPPIPTCTLHIATSTLGSCTDCPTQEHPEFCVTETSYYDYWCPANGACEVGYHCGESAEKELKIVCIEYGCINCCDEPNEPYCEYDTGDGHVYVAPVPEDCVCWQEE